MLSLNRIEHRTSDFRVNNWILDSGAFTRIASSRGHLPVEDYARQAARWASCGTLDAVVTQDYMCEPHILDLTGLTVPQHQQLSTENFLALRELVPHLYVMPVIQGYTPEEYADHVNVIYPLTCRNKLGPAWVRSANAKAAPAEYRPSSPPSRTSDRT